MIHAKEARQLITNKERLTQKYVIYTLKDLIDDGIEAALSKEMTQCTVVAPPEAEDSLLNATKAAIEKLGYKVRLEHRVGFMDKGLFHQPSTTITISW